MFEELLRALSLDLHTLVSRLRTVFAGPLYSARVVSITVASGTTTASAYHGLGRLPNGALASPETPLLLGVVCDSTKITLTASAAPGADVVVTVLVF